MPKTPPAAHSTCGQSADGAEWTNKTPRVVLIDPPSTSGRQREGCLPRHPRELCSPGRLGGSDVHSAPFVPSVPVCFDGVRLSASFPRSAYSGRMPTIPFGSWPSPITPELMTSSLVGLGRPLL